MITNFSNFIGSSPEIVVERLATDFIESINSQLEEKEYAYIALSGGNTPQLLFQLLANEYSNAINWERTHFFWVDERWVPHSSPESNFGNAHRIWFSKIHISESNLHPVKTNNVDIEKEALRYSQEIHHILPTVNHVPVFDIMLLGMGADGHIASIFPGNEHLFSSSEICAVASHPNTHQHRITLTGTVINNSRQIVMLITGENKSTMLQKVFEGSNEMIPARLVKPVNGQLTWYLDKAAGRFVEKYL